VTRATLLKLWLRDERIPGADPRAANEDRQTYREVAGFDRNTLRESRAETGRTLLARSGTEALGTIAKDETIVVLVADINMPGLAGSAALAERARSFRPELAVILLTGGAADSRGFPLLRKPFAQSDLRRVMAETTGLF
jgi:CheY-like chemotaxis protein